MEGKIPGKIFFGGKEESPSTLPKDEAEKLKSNVDRQTALAFIKWAAGQTKDEELSESARKYIEEYANFEAEILTSCDETRKTQAEIMKAKPFEILYKDEEIAVMKVGTWDYRVFMLDGNGNETREVLFRKEVKDGKPKYKAHIV